MQGLLQRRSVILSESEWLTEPWKDGTKSIEQIIYDYGLKVAGLFEKVDMLSKSDLDDAECLSVLRNCKSAQENIERIIIIDLIQLDDLATLLLKIVALGIALGACTSGCEVYMRLISDYEMAHIDGETVSIGTSLCYRQRNLAKAIICSIKTYVAGMDNITCNAKLVFPLQQAMMQLSPGDVAFAECVAIRQKLDIETWQFGMLLRPMNC